MNFDKLKLARQFNCKDCDLYADIYLANANLVRVGLMNDDPSFNEAILTELENHIREEHPDRASALLTPL